MKLNLLLKNEKHMAQLWLYSRGGEPGKHVEKDSNHFTSHENTIPTVVASCYGQFLFKSLVNWTGLTE